MSLPKLNSHEARVLGVLIEKAQTTPEQYPMSLNAATAGANQKSNRHPVTDYLEAEVDVALQGLAAKLLAGKVVPSGSRVEKFRHNASETLGLDDAHLAVLAELLMRGPQQPGELRARAQRMAPTPTLDDLMGRLERLIAAGYVRRLAPTPGSRAERYAQLLCPEAHPVDEAAGAVAVPAASAPLRASHPAAPASSGLEARVAALEAEVRELRAELDRLLR
jgi:uncharacterized protein YceH (UPF0502 family)